MAILDAMLAEVVGRLQARFPGTLVSVVLYGSQARGEAEAGSDCDLLVVVPGLPEEWRELFVIEDELACLGLELGKRLDIRLVEPEAVAYAVDSATPLMLEVGDAHRILFDPTSFFAREMSRFSEIMKKRGIERIRRGVWRVPAVAR